MGRGTRYQLVSESYPNDTPNSQSIFDKIKRRILAYRHSFSLLTSSPAKQLRYVALAVVVLVVLISSLPAHDLDSIDNASRFGPFNIQYAFKNETKSAKAIRTGRQSQVKAAFLHAWDGYKQHAWLHDEVQPLSGHSKDPYVGWAATLVDSLDTLYILGLQTEFDLALESVKSINFTKPNTERVPVFETTIRYLGGLLGSYDVSAGKYPILLEKARELGDFLFLAFNTTNGMPVPYYWWQKPGDKLHGEKGVLVAQVGSLSLEFTRLSQLTGDRKYFDAITRITNHFDKAQNATKLPGLWPSQINTDALTFTGRAFTLGAWADSLYEYLPKEHILLNGRTTDQYLNMYQKALESASKHHFFRPNIPGNHDILFTGSVDVNGGVPSLRPEVQHLGCFVGGMVALGAKINKSKKELETAAKLTEGCVWAYQNTATGIMPEIFFVQQCPETGSCHWIGKDSIESGHQHGFTRVKDSSYQLRPEAIESVFIMYRITGDPIWQEKGWNMFQAIMKHTTTSIANAMVSDVTKPSPIQQDSMESFWLAETLKYFYLLFSEPDLVSLDDFVLNTEAHPFRQRDHLFDI